MTIVKQAVQHKHFGKGIVIDQSETTIEVDFSESCGKKKFIYPDAFENFLTMSDAKLQDKIEDELNTIQEQAAVEQAQKIEEKKNQRKEKQEALLAAKKKKPATKKRKATKTKK